MGWLSENWQIVSHIWPRTPEFTPEKYPDLTGRTAVVTGGNAGIGKETVRLLARQHAKVFILARNEAKAKQTIEEITQETPGADLKFIPVDLADLTTIRPAAQLIAAETQAVHLIIHNAGVCMPAKGLKTVQGFDYQLGVNCIAHHLLQKLLDPLILRATAEFPDHRAAKYPCRIVWLSSSAHQMGRQPGGIDFEDINGETSRNSDLLGLYCQSKTGCLYQAYYWPFAHSNNSSFRNVVSIAVHPGYLATGLFDTSPRIVRFAVSFVPHHAEKGAYTELYAALSPEITPEQNGGYVIPWGQMGVVKESVKTAMEAGGGKKFWEYCDDAVAEYYEAL